MFPFTLQGDPSGRLKPPVDLLPTILAAGGPLLQLPSSQAGWWNIQNLSQREVLTILMGHPVKALIHGKEVFERASIFDACSLRQVSEYG